MYKSELWTLIHVLNSFGEHPRVKGVFWLTDKRQPESIQMPNSSNSMLVMPFDASYSGKQVIESVRRVLERTDYRTEVYAPIGVAKYDLMQGDNLINSIVNKMEDTEAARNRCKVLAGDEVHEKDFATQFKVPDQFSMDTDVSQLLVCALCCSGEDVKRSPYKFFMQRIFDPKLCSEQFLLPYEFGSSWLWAKSGFTDPVSCTCPAMS
eukprot:TRINITY_DN15421_c0_g1_i2.p1 TRINITY_DN15421_c0_g1~~TRINITY_DN15421_c0_g1_i2.p1  ORF type:complete len:208 (-),score=8.94 TRINITY_DN15421_c0_g1_i2:58-681(-)